jgi:uncharacterized integral membrane protein
MSIDRMTQLNIAFALALAVLILAPTMLIVVYAQNGTDTGGSSFVNASFNTILGITVFISALSGIVLWWVNKLRSVLANSKNENAKKLLRVFDDYLVPALEQGKKVAEITQKQEVKAKQLGEILYGFMGEKANEIKDKYEVKLVNLTADVDKATKGTIAYDTKLRQLEQLVEEIRGEVTAEASK